jgi:YidC/Oxa1 family membrane protein insertase
MEYFWLILWPISEAMRLFLEAAYAVLGDFGLAIVLLSMVVRVLTNPIAKLATRSEERSRAVQVAMAPELARIKSSSRGREQFEQIEALYERHGYHPIHSVKALLPLFLQVPFLLAAFFLLSDFPSLAGETFLFIRDLHQPDGLIALAGWQINLLPLLITAVALLESAIRTGGEPGSRLRFLILAIVIAVLIYPTAAAVCLYWLTSNLLSLGRAVRIRLSGNRAKEQLG